MPFCCCSLSFIASVPVTLPRHAPAPAGLPVSWTRFTRSVIGESSGRLHLAIGAGISGACNCSQSGAIARADVIRAPIFSQLAFLMVVKTVGTFVQLAPANLGAFQATIVYALERMFTEPSEAKILAQIMFVFLTLPLVTCGRNRRSRCRACVWRICESTPIRPTGPATDYLLTAATESTAKAAWTDATLSTGTTDIAPARSLRTVSPACGCSE